MTFYLPIMSHTTKSKALTPTTKKSLTGLILLDP